MQSEQHVGCSQFGKLVERGSKQGGSQAAGGKQRKQKEQLLLQAAPLPSPASPPGVALSLADAELRGIGTLHKEQKERALGQWIQ